MPLNTNETGSPGNDEHSTPWPLFNQLNGLFGFTLDVCARKENHKVNHYFTKEQNGLLKGWRKHRCWMNPPYSRGEIEKWVQKAAGEVQGDPAGETLVVALLPNSSDTKWYHLYVRPYAIVLPVRGRIRFSDEKQGAKFASIVAIYLPEICG
jgi:phage N-6-adenine-methyltransferase